jgi:hypothetical protein
MMSSRTACFAASALLIAASIPAFAVPVTYSFSGTSVVLGYGPGGNTFVGDPLFQPGSGSFTFDLDFGSLIYSTPTVGFYQPTSSAFGSFNLRMPDFPEIGEVSSAGSNCDDPYTGVRVADADPTAAFGYSSGPADQFAVSLACSQQIAPNLIAKRNFSFKLLQWDEGLDMVSGLDPTQSLDWTLANRAEFSYGYALFDSTCEYCTRSWTLAFDVDSMSRSTAVPEPGTWALLATGLLVGSAFGRRRVVGSKS